MLSILKRFNPLERSLLGLSSLLIVIIIIVLLAAKYFTSQIESKWGTISTEKNIEITNKCSSIFNENQSSLLNKTEEVLSSRKLNSAFSTSNVKKSYDAIEELDLKGFNTEIYNSRLELFLFSGKQLTQDITDLKKALDGERFTTVKEIGFYIFLVAYSAYTSDSAGMINGKKRPDGVLVLSKLIDIEPNIRMRFFPGFGLTKEIQNKLGVQVSFEFPQSYSMVVNDTSKDESVSELKNNLGQVIGKIKVPMLEHSSYQLKVLDNFIWLIKILIIILNFTLVVLLYRMIKFKFSDIVSKAAMIFLLVISRYICLYVDFPYGLFSSSTSAFFSPAYFASNFGFGVVKSVGNLLLTSVAILVICFIILSIVQDYFRKEKDVSRNSYTAPSKILGSVILFLLLLHFYGNMIQRLVYESNIRFFDRGSIISTSDIEVLSIQAAILFLSISLLLLFFSLYLTTAKSLKAFFPNNQFLRNNSSVVFGIIVILIDLFVEFLPQSVNEPSLNLNLRLLVISLFSVLSVYLYRRIHLLGYKRLLTLANLSVIFLIAAIFTPLILLNKVTSQENKYLEQEAKSISKQVNDKAGFVLLSAQDELAENLSVKSDLNNKNKTGRMAFNIWAAGKLSSEELNTAVFVIDTNRKVVSDFNINPSEFNSDSVVNFALRNFKMIVHENPQTDTMEYEDESAELLSEQILQNKDQKFYCTIVPIGQENLGTTKLSKPLGYVILSAQYDSKNYFVQQGFQLFKTSRRENIVNKLTSEPIYSEFSDGEIAGSSNRDISRSFIKSLDAFRTSVSDRIDKSAMRFDEFEGNIYKSFYVLKEPGGKAPEKIFVVSIKVNDFAMFAFFIFKFLLFIVFIYFIFIVLYFLYKTVIYIRIHKGQLIRFGFREKVFASFFVVSVIPIIILAVYTREYVKNKNTQFYNSQMISDLRIVEQYIKSRLTQVDISKHTKPPAGETQQPISNFFGKGFAESYKNFNFFVKNRLIATTNEELYKSGFLDFRLSANAYYNSVLLKRDFYTENEVIGSYTFIVGYKPIYDNTNNLLGIISTQTVFRQYEINQELTESLVYIFGTYIITVILLIILVNYLTYRISNPILRLQQATEQLSRGNVDVEVKVSTKDEIGELISSFNKMTREIKRSRTELKKVERESAWRDIARQVAHEIKNPLTPMKLAMQHLYYAYTNSSKDFKSIIQTTNKLIIDQIESLNRIATEFSDFAKMPSRNYQQIDIEEIVYDVAKLLNTNGKISVMLEVIKGKTEITGDKDEVKRALINIIRNSMQAVEQQAVEQNTESEEKTAVNISSYRLNGFYHLKIKDNGIGMDEDTLQKLFEPYFSTKSSGMGLGLVITKKILDDMQAHITVRSKVNEGTEVEIMFRLN